MTRLMVLGGGRHQLQLIKRAEQRGLEVVLVDYLRDAPGRAIATHSELADATEPKVAIDLAKRYQVDGVITTGTDIPIRTMAAVADALVLPCYLTTEAAHRATDKQAMYETLVSAGVPMAGRIVIDKSGPAEPQSMPVVVKPADSQGQRGIMSVTDRSKLSDAIGNARASSRSRRVLIEEYLEGPEFTANAWIRDGQVSLLMVNDRVTFNPSPFLGIAFQHRYPSQAAERFPERVHTIIENVARAYQIKTGPLYIQMIRTEDGPVVVEAAARVGGGHESRLLIHLNQWSPDDALIDIALGLESSPPPPLPADSHALVNFILGSSGIVGQCEPLETASGIIEAAWYVRPGDRLTDVVNSLGRVGYFIATAQTAASLLGVAEAYYGKLALPSEEGQNLVHQPDQRHLNGP